MKEKDNLIEPLLERVESYGKTSFELIKLKTLDKTADIASTSISRLLLLLTLLIFALTLNIAISLWLGDLFGKIYYGFLAVASFYALLSILLYFIHPSLKARINNSIVSHLLN